MYYDVIRQIIIDCIDEIFAPIDEFANSVLEEAGKGVKELKGLLDSDSIDDKK